MESLFCHTRNHRSLRKKHVHSFLNDKILHVHNSRSFVKPYGASIIQSF